MLPAASVRRLVPIVEWRDLCALSRRRVAYEATLPLPYLALSLALAHLAFSAHPLWLLAALAASFYVFLTALRVVHNAFHYTLGLPRRATEAWMLLCTVLLLGWMHAVQVTHLEHHRRCLEPEDVEARGARLAWWQSIACGPCFPFWVLRRAWALGHPAQRRWIALEVAYNALVLPLIFLPDAPVVLRYHLAAMVVGQCLFPFFGVWSVHHDVDGRRTVARTIRRALADRLTFAMFYHLEHHLFPRVPTCHLRTLAQRLDARLGADEVRHVL